MMQPLSRSCRFRTGCRWLAWGLAAAWFAGSVWLLWRESTGSAPLFAHADKAGHFLLFAVQTGLLRLALGTGHTRLILLLAAVWAAGSETGQVFLTVSRTGDLLDALADMAGCVAVLAWVRRWS